MSLLQLQDIGKIYVSNGTVAVGIRGVNLEFDIGEFVAITGKSGSGKTTLLNVISGMDSYEEGELYVEGQPTSHYTQADWELYRQQYISFIFQDYNIIESFTVQQNVELALMHIPSKKARRARALELIERVGLLPFRHHKGSKLSGGQKQRTVIARALAKDSPIILADEPTGNLDSQSSKEIIALLKEISKEKLVIVVTHSFAQLEEHATREIRIYDGAVAQDEHLKTPAPAPEHSPAQQVQNSRMGNLKKAFTLGRHRFFAMPKLSAFLSIVLLLAMLGTVIATAALFTDLDITRPNYIFQPIDGRVPIVRQDGKPISDTELAEIAQKTGAKSYLSYDRPLDKQYYFWFNKGDYGTSVTLRFDYNGAYTPDVGRLPQNEKEVFLYLPITCQPIFGKDTLEKKTIELFGDTLSLQVSGVAYYYDNTKEGKIVLTQKGYEEIGQTMFFYDAKEGNDFYVEMNAKIPFTDPKDPNYSNGESGFSATFWNLQADPTLQAGEFYFIAWDYKSMQEQINHLENENYQVNKNAITADLTTTIRSYNYGESDEHRSTLKDLKLRYDLCKESGSNKNNSYTIIGNGSGNMYYDTVYSDQTIFVSPETLQQMMQPYYDTYTQASLFFQDNQAAEEALSVLRTEGYLGVLTDATYTSGDDMIFGLIMAIVMVVAWIAIVLFLTFFMNLCTSRAMQKTKGDLGILRSMGIPMQIIRLSTYAQMICAMLPALAVTAAVMVFIYRFPKTNNMYPFMQPMQYVLIFLGAVLMCIFAAKRHNKKMFSQSVRKTLKGGDRE